MARDNFKFHINTYYYIQREIYFLRCETTNNYYYDTLIYNFKIFQVLI